MSVVLCPECAREMSDTLNICPHCGFKVKTKKDSSAKIVIPIVALVIVVSGCIWYSVFTWLMTARWDYNCREVYYAVIDSAAEIEDTGNLINSVWYNSIWQEEDPETDKYTMRKGVFYDDFNDALEKLYDDKEFISNCSNIIDDKELIDDYMDLLREPPKSRKEQYDAISEVYDAYYDFYDAVMNTGGKSLQTFHDDFSKTDKALSKKWNKMERYF